MTASSSRLGCGGATVEPVTLGQRGEEPLGAGAHGGLVGVHGGQQVGDVLVVLALQEREQQMRGGQIRVAPGDGPAACRVDRVPALVGQLGIHVRSLLLVVRLGNDFTTYDPSNVHKVESIPLKVL